MAHIYNPSAQEAEAGGSQIQGQPELHDKARSKTKMDIFKASLPFLSQTKVN